LPLPCHAGRARICRFATLRCSRAMACAGLCGEILCTSGKVPKTRPWSLVEDRCRGQRREGVVSRRFIPPADVLESSFSAAGFYLGLNADR